jgi:hypothetical protein
VLRIAWVSRLAGIDRQTDLGMEPIGREERDALEDRLGMEVSRLRPDNGRSARQEEISLTEGQFAYLLDNGGTDPDVLHAVQVGIEDGEGEQGGQVSLSAVASPAAAATLAGFTPDALYAAVGELPASVAVLVRIALPDPAEPEQTTVLEEIRIGNITLPATLVDSANKEFDKGMETFFLNQYGIRLESMVSDGDKIRIEGAIPVGETNQTT